MNAAINDLLAKDRLLEEAGYRYSLRNEIYVNKAKRKVFSLEFVEDRTEEDIRKCMMEEPSPDDWQFYFRDELSASVRDQLIRRLSNGQTNR